MPLHKAKDPLEEIEKGEPIGGIVKSALPIYDAGSVDIPSEPVELLSRPPEPEIEALEEKPIPRGVEVVEPASLETIRNRKNAHQARLRR